MTILSCQKRHHEPHITEKPRPSPYGWRYSVHWCDGLPQWPYARPKPPRINSFDYDAYIERHRVIGVWSNSRRWNVDPWDVDQWCDQCNDIHFKAHPTHAEAIQYAQNLVNERRENSGS